MEALHQPGEIIAQRYRITDTLGQGGVGITYAAQDLKSGQQVALKALSVRQMGDWKVLELFEREARILEQLNHPAIPRYLDYFEVDTPEDRAFYIAQELAEGKSLADLVAIGWRTNEDGVRRIATQILEILVYLHTLKPPVVHRDIKPQNLIWGKDGKIFLVDFGAVQDTYRSTFAKGSTIIGTYGYMAPEQFLGQAVPATDLYGLGATVLFLLTHRSPSDLPQERLKISFRSRIQVSDAFADWLEKMLEPDVEDRFSSAKEALAALQGRMVVAKPRSSVSWKALVGVGVAAVAAVTVLNSFKWAVLGTLGFQPVGMCNAIGRGDITRVKNYLNQGGNPYAYDPDTLFENDNKDAFVTLVDCALFSDKEEFLELMLAKIKDFNARDNRSRTLLHLATRLRRKDIVERLIISGADVKAKDLWGRSPLHYVRSKEVAELLIAKGADVKARTQTGEAVLDSAVRRGNKDLVELLIAKGADVNAKSSSSYAALHYVRSKEVAELLIAKGADVKARTQNGLTVLHSALDTGNKDLVELLIAKGADVNAKTLNGETLLHSAVINRRNKDLVELLIAKGADVNAKTLNGETLLHSALDTGNKDLVELLIAKGADVNAKTLNVNGETLLHSALDTGNKDLVELLIAKGADVNVKTPYGKTPLQSAIDRGNKDLVELLIAKGADVNARDDAGLTPLHWAIIYRHWNIVTLLKSHGGIE
jgi:ankyrin repeat protein